MPSSPSDCRCCLGWPFPSWRLIPCWPRGKPPAPSGAAIAGAKVTITSTDHGLKRSVKTDHAGRFNFPQLKPGPYSVKAEADQFETQENNSVLAGLGQKQTV